MCTPASWAGKHAIKKLAKRPAETAVPASPVVQKQRTLFFGKPPETTPPEDIHPTPLPPPVPVLPPREVSPAAAEPDKLPSGLLSLDVPWCESPRVDPLSVDAVVLQPQATKRSFFDWTTARLEKRSDVPRLCVLSGPSGCGKRALVRTVCKVLNLQCMEPDVITLEEVCEVLEEDVATRPFTLGPPMQRRVWLITGLDGLFKSAASNSSNTSAKSLKKILTIVDRAGYGMDPLVFTVHDFEGSVLQQLRTSRSVFHLASYRLEATRPVELALGRVCDLAGLPRSVVSSLLASFDGDMKQAMLRLEFACRVHRKGNLPYARPCLLDAKDSELTDPFEAVRIVLNTRVSLQPDFLCEVLDRFNIMETLLWCNYLVGMDHAAAPCPCHTMRSVASLAQAWESLSMASTQYANPALKDALRLSGLMAMRTIRAASGCRPLSQGAKLTFAPKPSKFDTAGMLAMTNSTLMVASRQSQLERLERLEVSSYYEGKATTYKPMCPSRPDTDCVDKTTQWRSASVCKCMLPLPLLTPL